MPFVKVPLQLTEEQRLAIHALSGDPETNQFAILGQAYVNSGRLVIYILSAEQFQFLNPLIAQAQRMDAYKKTN